MRERGSISRLTWYILMTEDVMDTFLLLHYWIVYIDH